MAVLPQYFQYDHCRVYRKRLRAQPCGALVLAVMVEDVVVMTLTVWGQSLRKLCISWMKRGVAVLELRYHLMQN